MMVQGKERIKVNKRSAQNGILKPDIHSTEMGGKNAARRYFKETSPTLGSFLITLLCLRRLITELLFSPTVIGPSRHLYGMIGGSFKTNHAHSYHHMHACTHKRNLLLSQQLCSKIMLASYTALPGEHFI